LLRALCIRSSLPSIVAPKSVHSFDAILRSFVGIAPNGIPVHIHDRKIEKHIDGPRVSGLPHDTPIEMQAVRIKQAKCSIVFSYLIVGSSVCVEIRTSVAGMNIDVRSISAQGCKMARLVCVHIDEIEMVKRRRDL